MMLYKLLVATNRREFDPFVVVLSDKGILGARIESLGISVHSLEMQAGKFSLPKILTLRRLVVETKPDLIQAWMYHSNVVASLLYYLGVRVPILWNIRHTPYNLRDYKKATYWVIRSGAWISRQPYCIIYNSNTSAKRHYDLGYFNKNSIVIPNGFDVQKFRPQPKSRLVLRNSLGLSENSFLIGLIARFHPMKDHAGFLQAAAKLAPNYPDVHFVLAGREVDDDNEILASLVHGLGLEKKVHLIGEISDVADVIPALDIISLSSSWGDAFPNIIGEAMSCEIPCVTTDIGDSAQIVGDTGVSIPPKDPDALCGAWLKLIGMNSEERHDLGKAARERITKNFSLPKVVSQYESLYINILGK